MTNGNTEPFGVGMKHETITIEMKKETAVMMIWLAAGMLLVLSAFFLFGESNSLWEPLMGAGIAGGVYLTTLVVYCTRPPISFRRRWITIGMTALTAAAAVVGWAGQKERSQWQRETLLSIRTVIGGGIAFHATTDILRKPFEEFHAQQGRVRKSLGETFLARYSKSKVGANIYTSESQGDSLQVILERVDDQKVVLVVLDPIARGRDPMFRNIDGRLGKLQQRFFLREKGLTYESEN